MFNNFFFKNCSINEIMWKNVLEPDGATEDNNMVHAHCNLDD